MADTSIQWTDRTWNPVTGCTKVSPGCKYCYAERVFPRAYSRPDRSGAFRKFTDVRTHADRLDHPLHWRSPKKIFVNSMSDLFHEDVPFEFIDKVFAVMALCPQHTFQVLTKRPERMREYMALPNPASRLEASCRGMGMLWKNIPIFEWPLPSVWLGVSVENQQYADERIPILLDTPSAIRFVSYEPALGPVDFTRFLSTQLPRMLDWVIVGGESGPKARPFWTKWARDTIRQCRSANVPVFVKQVSKRPVCHCDDAWPTGTHYDAVSIVGTAIGDTTEDPGKPFGLCAVLNDPKGGDWSEWPEDLRVREFPR